MSKNKSKTHRKNNLYKHKKTHKKTKKQSKSSCKKGGSLASDRVMEAVNTQNPGVDGYQKQMHLPSQTTLTSEFKTQTYELTGGSENKQVGGKKGDMKKNLVALIDVARSNPEMKAEQLIKNFHAARPMARRVSHKELINGVDTVMKGGNGFLSLAGCGPANVPDAGRKYAHHFSKTSSCPGPEEIANPPNLENAGSGMDNLGVGAPVLK